jgi:hypothetical protein
VAKAFGSARAARTCLACAALAILMVVSACARSTGTSGAFPLRGHGAVVEVRNDEFDDVVVYLIRGGTPIPLGVVPGLTRRTFGVSESQLADGGAIALGAGARGGPVQRSTSPFDLVPGRIATWIVRAGNRVEQPVVR